jgi:predicted Zn-dependent protease
MTQNTRISYEGKDYIWTGTDWCDAETFLTPPLVIVRKLNRLLEQELRSEDTAISDTSILIRRASAARDALQYDRAEALTRRALELSPGNCAALAVLCSVLRAQGRPQQALDETEVFRQEPHPPLLTSRAAAFCDLKRWKEAKQEIGRALAIEKSEEAFNVVHRIKAERPDLYR